MIHLNAKAGLGDPYGESWRGRFSRVWVWKGPSLCVLCIFPDFFKKDFIWERMREQKWWLRGLWGGEEGQAGTELSAETEAWFDPITLRSWPEAGQTSDTLSHTGAPEGSLSKEVGLGPLPLQGLEKDEEPIKTGSGGGRKEQGRCPFRASAVSIPT